MNTLKMNTLKVLTTDSHVYNVKRNINVEEKLMESRPVNPERAVDQKLVEKAQKGDKKAFGMLVEKYQRRLTRLLSRMVRDQSEIEDIVQDSFIKAFKNMASFKGEVSFGAWIKRIVINNCLDFLKKRKLALVSINEEVHHLTDVDDDWSVDYSYEARVIARTIETLKDKYRLVLSLYLLEGYDHQEIAAILGITEVTSRTHLMRGKQQLKEILKEQRYVEGY